MEKYFLLLNSEDEFRQYSAMYYFSEIYEEIKEIMNDKYGYARRQFWNDELEKGFGKFFFDKSK